jgi:hypothetical protein
VSRCNGNGTFNGNDTLNNGMVNGFGQNEYPILIVNILKSPIIIYLCT